MRLKAAGLGRRAGRNLLGAIATLAIALLAVALMPPSASAAVTTADFVNGAPPTTLAATAISPNLQSCTVGSSCTVDVGMWVGNATYGSTYGVDFTIHFDPTVLQATSITTAAGSPFQTSPAVGDAHTGFSPSIDNTLGVIQYSAMGGAFSGGQPFTVATIVFNPIAAGTSSLGLVPEQWFTGYGPFGIGGGATSGSVTVTGGAAVACAPGTYSATGNTPCTPAPAGSFVATSGATSATLCPAGKFSATAGSVQCAAAPAGSFVATAGASAATLCPAGTFSATTASAQCTLSPAGSYVATQGATAPTACPAGTGSPAGATECTPVQTLSILGGVGTAYQPDANTDWSQDPVAWNAGVFTTSIQHSQDPGANAWHFTGNANPTWHPAYDALKANPLGAQHDWGVIPGTDYWLNCGPYLESSACGSSYGNVVEFRTRFTIPAGSIDPQITLYINSDNAGTYYLNGTQITDRLVGGGGGQKDTPVQESGCTSGSAYCPAGVHTAALLSAIHTGVNELDVVVEDWGGLAGFNYRADLTVLSNTAPTQIPAATPTTTQVSFGAGPFVYKGSAFTATATVSPAAAGNATITYSGDCTNVGSTCTATATYAGNDTYAPSSATASITITPAPVTVTAGSGTSTYDGATHAPSACAVTGTYIGALTCSNDPALAGPNVGSTTITPVIAGDTSNFTVTTVNGTYGIAPAHVTATAGGGTATYDGTAKTPDACVVTGNYIGNLTCVDLPATVGPDAGTTTIVPLATGSDAANFVINVANGSYTITPAPVTATAGGGSATYDGTAKTPDACTVSGAYTGDLTCVDDPSSVGPDAGPTTIAPVVSGTGLSNFDVTSVDATYTIDPAPTTTSVTFGTDPFVFNGTAFTATATVDPADAGAATIAYTGDCVNPGDTCTATATFAATNNYLGSQASATITIVPEYYVCSSSKDDGHHGDDHGHGADGHGHERDGHGPAVTGHEAGSAVVVKVDVCDINGHDVSSRSLQVLAVGLSPTGTLNDEGHANRGNVFRYTDGVYTYNLDTKGLAPGDYTLDFTIGNDPTVQHYAFTIRAAPLHLHGPHDAPAQVGQAYSSSLSATGGVGPYTYAIVSGALPDGLSLDPATGAITGTPTAAGKFHAKVQVTDSQGTPATDTVDVTIEVRAATNGHGDHESSRGHEGGGHH